MEQLLQTTQKNGRVYTYRKDNSQIFSPKEWKKFMNVLRPSSRPLFDCLINTGARITEAINIEKRDIDFKRKTITLRVVKKRNPYADGRIRTIKVSTQYLDRLKEYTANMVMEERLFKGTKVNYSHVFKNGLKRAGLNPDKFSLHNIRKTSECWLSFLNVNHLMILLRFGHDQSTALKHYLINNTYSSKEKYEARMILGDLYM